MIKRTNTKKGDIFSVRIEGNKRKFFQYIANDITQLNSDVIRAFKEEYKESETINFEEVVEGEVEFYAHCVIKWGIKSNHWEKVGSSKNIGLLDKIIFRDTRDYGYKKGEEPIKISNNWYVWKINDSDFNRVGKLEGENRNAEIGIVMNADNIVHRIKTGHYKMLNYPDFE